MTQHLWVSRRYRGGIGAVPVHIELLPVGFHINQLLRAPLLLAKQTNIRATHPTHKNLRAVTSALLPFTLTRLHSPSDFRASVAPLDVLKTLNRHRLPQHRLLISYYKTLVSFPPFFCSRPRRLLSQSQCQSLPPSSSVANELLAGFQASR